MRRQMEPTLSIQDLIDARSRELGLRRSELVRRCGYNNISKGHRMLDELYAGDLQKATSLLAGLPVALELSPEIVRRALEDTIRQLEQRASHSAGEAEAAWRATFKPQAYLLGTQSRPSQIVFFAITGGAERWLKIPLDFTRPPLSFAGQALAVVRKTPFVQYFGPTTGFIVNYSPDHAVRSSRQVNQIAYARLSTYGSHVEPRSPKGLGRDSRLRAWHHTKRRTNKGAVQHGAVVSD